MHGGVATQVAAADEGLAAARTPELLAVRVDAHVDLQGAGLSKAFAAVDAAVALLAGVDALVSLQVARVGEALPAQRAHERLLARVDPHVGVQVLQGGQSFATAVADEHSRSGVTPTLTSGPGHVILTPPPVTSDGSILPVRGVFPCRNAQRPLPVVPLLSCRLLKWAAAATRVCGSAQTRVHKAARILTQRILGSDCATLDRRLRVLARPGCGGHVPTHPPRSDITNARYFLFDQWGRGFRLRHQSINDTPKFFWRFKKENINIYTF